MNFETLQLDSPEIPELCRQKYREQLGHWPDPGEMDDRAAVWAMAWLMSSQWTPVTDGLPPKNVEVLAMLSHVSTPCTAQYTGNPYDQDPAGWCYPSENFGLGPDGENPVVTHWMLLPATPAEQEARHG